MNNGKFKSFDRQALKPHSNLRGWTAFLLALFCALHLAAQPAIPSTGATLLDSWSFRDTTNWTDDYGDAPVSFTNLSWTFFGAGNALVVNSTNEAWLQFDVFQDGWTNMTVNEGTIAMWFSPGWSSASLGGTGPGGAYGALLETGSYTPEATVGWWGIYVSSNGNNIYFSAQTNSGLQTNYLSAPIAWTNGGYHLIAVTYTATNSLLYLDGTNAASGPGVGIYPDDQILSNGFWIGSASNGVSQCHGAISGLETYGNALDSNAISGLFVLNSIFYGATEDIAQAPSEPQASPTYEVISGPGYLLTVSSNSGCANNSSVWITNTSAVMSNGAVNLTFTISGGTAGLPYDVFATPALTKPLTNGLWSWMGQGYPCCTYTIPGLTNGGVYLLLGTPQDSDGDGLTDAYELLVSHTNPYSADSTGDGLPDGWNVLNGLDAADGAVAGEDPDNDGLSNLQEYLYGSNPEVSEGFALWVAEPGGASMIP